MNSKKKRETGEGRVTPEAAGCHLYQPSLRPVRQPTILPLLCYPEPEKIKKISSGCVFVGGVAVPTPPPSPPPLLASLISSFPPPTLSAHVFPASLHVFSLAAVLYMPSARVRAQLSQQCFYCVAHMEKITATGQFSPWSYVNSFDGMSGLSPVCGGTEASEGFRSCINIQPQH